MLLPKASQKGFTLIELLVVMAVSVVVAITMYTLFITAIDRFWPLQEEGMAFSDLASGSQRIASVLRGLTDISSVSNNDITVYAYFSPQDAYVSQIHYYQSNGGLKADVIPLDANPPNGHLLTAQERTYTIIGSLFIPSGKTLFMYFDASNTQMIPPITDEHNIKAIQVNLGIPIKSPTAGSDTISLQVSLRNRKTNL